MGESGGLRDQADQAGPGLHCSCWGTVVVLSGSCVNPSVQ